MQKHFEEQRREQLWQQQRLVDAAASARTAVATGSSANDPGA